MTNKTALGELAGFVARSPLTSSDDATRNHALTALATRLVPRMQRRSVGELLATVLALSARTRRLVLSPVDVQVEVYGPDGRRAVELSLRR